jgi:uncharacterized protein
MSRIVAVDALRGAAVLGILLMNVVSFAYPFVVYDIPTVAGGATGADFWWWYWTDVLADGKMRAIFSMLFGASLILMWRRSDPLTFGDLYARRCLWLLVIGVLHAFLIWDGDILYTYALCGLLLFPFRVLRPRTLVLAAVLVMCVVTLRQVVKAMEAAPTDMRPSRAVLEREAQPMRGSWSETFRHRIGGVMRWQSTGFYKWAMWDALGMMLLGMALFKMGVLTGDLSVRQYAAMATVAYAVGLPVAMWSAQSTATMQFEPVHHAWLGILYEPVRVAVAIGHVAVLMLLCRNRVFPKVFAPVGRMALTNYLLTSLLCTFVFYGYGLGLYMKLARHELYWVVAVVWTIQIVFTHLWLRWFDYGPVEWAWRSLIHWHRFPIRGKTVLLIDTDRQGSVSLIPGVKPE